MRFIFSERFKNKGCQWLILKPIIILNIESGLRFYFELYLKKIFICLFIFLLPFKEKSIYYRESELFLCFFSV